MQIKPTTKLQVAALSVAALTSVLLPSLAQAGGRPTTGPIRIVIDDRGSAPSRIVKAATSATGRNGADDGINHDVNDVRRGGADDPAKHDAGDDNNRNRRRGR